MHNLLALFAVVAGVTEVLCDTRFFHNQIDQGQVKKQQKINKDELDKAIKQELDRFFRTSHPIDKEFGIPADKMSEVKTTFSVGDKNHDGQLTIQEMKELVDAKLTEKELQALMAAADTNGDGKLSPQELAAHIAKTEFTDHNLRADFDKDKFNLMDLNKDGSISEKEFERLYRFCNQNFNRQLIQKIVQVSDTNKDQQVDYKELNSLLKEKPDTLSAGDLEDPQSKATDRIRSCIERFVDRCKNGFCNRPLRKTRASLRDLWDMLVLLFKRVFGIKSNN